VRHPGNFPGKITRQNPRTKVKFAGASARNITKKRCNHSRGQVKKKKKQEKKRPFKGFCPRRSCYLKKKKQEKGAQPKVFVRAGAAI
jgi:hypothetical protein